MKHFLARVFVILFPLSCFSWDAKGHRIVADIAYANLSRKARKHVDNILGKRGMIYMSSWADEIKSDTIYPESDGWHFQNLNSGLTDADIEHLYNNKLSDGEHVLYVLDSLTTLLSENGMGADPLKFVVHLSGDLFQPMHMGHSDDKGGNAVKMIWFGNKTNLHLIWDRWLLDHTMYSYSEYSEYLQNKYRNRRKEIMSLSELECLKKTYEAVEAVYRYQDLIGQTPARKYEYTYYYNMRDTLDYQLYTAGIQLAVRLNNIYRK